MNKLLIIVGPTATGKTSMAVNLADSLVAEIISADSRQVYKGLDIGTGKDKPYDRIIYGYDLIEPTNEFSVSQYQQIARQLIKDMWKKRKLPILVGGTGFYIKAVTDGMETISVPKNEKLRKLLSKLTKEELLNTLKKVDSQKHNSLNNSDKNNPVRLIRAIEVAKSSIYKTNELLKADTLFIGLFSDRKRINSNIEKRVTERLKKGFKEEFNELVNKGVGRNSQAMQSLGYRQWWKLEEDGYSEEQAIKEWIKEEQKYAKRQMTWFKKDKRIKWFDISKPRFKESVERYVKKWHNIK